MLLACLDRLRPRPFALFAVCCSLLLWAPVFAQTPASEAAPDVGPPDAAVPAPSDEITPPALVSQANAPYPQEALEQRLEADVGLALKIDASGRVVDVQVIAPAGHGFDEAAVAAAREFVFEPAKHGGVAIASTVQFRYQFRLPPAVSTEPAQATAAEAQAPIAKSAETAAPTTPSAPPESGPATFGASAMVTPPLSAASSFAVRDRDFALRPIGSVQDILRVTPGLVLVQHSGGGKANQYFIRGFDADHGTDLALSIDGVPINMVSHAHGQGYSDTNFIIPEVVERVELSKGPYFASQGDFATGGSINLVSRKEFEQSSVGFGLSGSPGHGEAGYRGLVIASPKLDGVKSTFAAELSRSNGPFDHPEGWDKYKLFNKVSIAPSRTSTLSFGEMSYGSNWNGSGQIPARAVDSGALSRFGSIDPDEGGNTARHQFYLHYKLRPSAESELNAMAYVAAYRFNLFSDFTLFLRDPDHGDEIEQVDRRSFYGGRVNYRVVHTLEGVRLDTRIGADVRSDDIHEQLRNTEQRDLIDTVSDDAVHETLGGIFVNEEVSPTDWLRVDVGGRADLISFAVDDQLEAEHPNASGSGVGAAHQLSPKTSLVLTPLHETQAQLDVYVNYGHGFHSNDVRGVFARPSVTPLTRAIGEEVGSRARLLECWDLALAFWQLDLANETVWVGDEGTTEVSGATRRRGVELETRFEFTSWLAADLDLTFTHSDLKQNAGNGNGLALAPKQTWSGGLSARHALGPGTARGGLRFYGIGDRPASDDGKLIAPGFTQVDLHIGYRYERFDLAFDIENLLNGVYRSAQFDTTSRLRTEPGIGAALPSGFSCGKSGRLASAPDGGAANGRFYGCEDVNYTPAYPFTARVLATLFLD